MLFRHSFAFVSPGPEPWARPRCPLFMHPRQTLRVGVGLRKREGARDADGKAKRAATKAALAKLAGSTT